MIFSDFLPNVACLIVWFGAAVFGFTSTNYLYEKVIKPNRRVLYGYYDRLINRKKESGNNQNVHPPGGDGTTRTDQQQSQLLTNSINSVAKNVYNTTKVTQKEAAVLLNVVDEVTGEMTQNEKKDETALEMEVIEGTEIEGYEGTSSNNYDDVLETQSTSGDEDIEIVSESTIETITKKLKKNEEDNESIISCEKIETMSILSFTSIP